MKLENLSTVRNLNEELDSLNRKLEKIADVLANESHPTILKVSFGDVKHGWVGKEFRKHTANKILHMVKLDINDRKQAIYKELTELGVKL